MDGVNGGSEMVIRYAVQLAKQDAQAHADQYENRQEPEVLQLVERVRFCFQLWSPAGCQSYSSLGEILKPSLTALDGVSS